MNEKNYNYDRSFTDKMHSFAIEYIYPELGFMLNTSDTKELADLKDMKNGVDYIANNKNGETIYIQERFRRYSENSFTLRYKREYSKDEVELFSEFFKIKQATRKMKCDKFILLYGISNIDETGIACIIAIDLQQFFNQVRNGLIIVDENLKYKSKIENNVLHGAIYKNVDSSSTMTFFDCSQIYTLFPEMILYNKGFLLNDNDRKNSITQGQKELIKQLLEKHTASIELLNQTEAENLIDCLKQSNNNLFTLLKSKNFRFNPVVSNEINTTVVIGNKANNSFHKETCDYAPKKQEKRIVFVNTQEALAAGFRPCNTCNPLKKEE